MRFVVVYQREPHARQLAFADVPQPTTRDERVALARKTLEELNLSVDVWIDESDASRAAFGDLPNWGIVIDPAGTLRLKLPWADPSVLETALTAVQAEAAAARPAPRDATFLAAIATPPPAGAAGEWHDRHTMLAVLAAQHPEHPQRNAWLDELSADPCPPQQRGWVASLLARPKQTEPR